MGTSLRRDRRAARVALEDRVPQLYRTVDGVPQLERSVVCFLDVLGSADRMRGPDAQANLAALHRAIERAVKRFLDDPHFEEFLAVVWFTDNVAIGWPLDRPDGDSESDLGLMFVLAGWFMLEMALAGQFMRGGLTVGEVYIGDHYAFGPALIAATELEKKVAVHPRTALSRDVMALAAGHADSYYAETWTAPQSLHLLSDDRGVSS